MLCAQDNCAPFSLSLFLTLLACLVTLDRLGQAWPSPSSNPLHCVFLDYLEHDFGFGFISYLSSPFLI